MKTDKDWEKWGASDPYFGVISNDKYRRNNLTNDSREDFFSSGVEHVSYLCGLINKNFNQNFEPNSVLDFGCGVGRLAIPFASIAKSVLGVDISPSMLEIAKKNSVDKSVKNIKFVISDDALSKVIGTYSLIHSYIVFQHIPKSRGHKIILRLAEKVEVDGFLALHIFTASQASALVRALVRLRYNFPPIQWGWNLLKKRPFFEPPMQLNCYDASYLEVNLKKLGFAEVKFIEVPSIEEFTGVFMIAKRLSNKS